MDQDQNAAWQYKPDNKDLTSEYTDKNAAIPAEPAPAGPETVAWQAPEFIEHKHDVKWYSALILGTALVAAIVYLTSKDIFATVVTVIIGVIVGVFAGHKPAQVKYEITSAGLSIEGKTYPFNAFKSFSIYHEGALNSVSLFPLKRFSPAVSAYFLPQDEPKIAGALGNYLPYEARELDGIDRLTRRLRL